MGFPFDPLDNKPTGSNKIRFIQSIIDGKKYFDQSEILLADELWDFLSDGKNTMEQILEIINSIATKEFYEEYCKLIQPEFKKGEKENILKKVESLFRVENIRK